MDKARAGDYSIDIDASVATAVLRDNGDGMLAGTAGIAISGGFYSIDESKLPAGVSVTGSSYEDGDTFTITAPMRYAGQTVTIADAIVLHDTRSPANVFWYMPVSTQWMLQPMVVYDFTPQPVARADLTFTSTATGTIRIAKTNADPGMGDYSLEGAIFEVRNSDGTLIDTVITDSNGIAITKELPLGEYTVTETQAPFGYVRNPDTFTIQLS